MDGQIICTSWAHRYVVPPIDTDRLYLYETVLVRCEECSESVQYLVPGEWVDGYYGFAAPSLGRPSLAYRADTPYPPLEIMPVAEYLKASQTEEYQAVREDV